MKTSTVEAIECPSCQSSFPVDPGRVPLSGVNAICSQCWRVFFVPPMEASASIDDAGSVEGPEFQEGEDGGGFESLGEAPFAGSGLTETEPEGGLDLPGVTEVTEEDSDLTEDLSFPGDLALPEDEGVSEKPGLTGGSELDAEPEPDSGPELDGGPELDAGLEVGGGLEMGDGAPLLDEPDLADEPDLPDKPDHGGKADPFGDLGLPGASELDESEGLDEMEAPGDTESLEDLALTEEVAPSDGPGLPEDRTSQVDPSPPRGRSVFSRRDPHERAQRLARVLVSDMIVYHSDRHQRALQEGTLRQEFQDEIDKSWEQYVQQVGAEMAESTEYFRDALNTLLARGDEVF